MNLPDRLIVSAISNSNNAVTLSDPGALEIETDLAKAGLARGMHVVCATAFRY